MGATKSGDISLQRGWKVLQESMSRLRSSRLKTTATGQGEAGKGNLDPSGIVAPQAEVYATPKAICNDRDFLERALSAGAKHGSCAHLKSPERSQVSGLSGLFGLLRTDIADTADDIFEFLVAQLTKFFLGHANLLF